MSAIIANHADTSAGDTITKDAALLDSIDLSSTMDLHRSNLMRMQVTELLEECQLDLKGRKWAIEAHEYLQQVTKLVSDAAKQYFVSKKEETAFSIQERADKVVHMEKIVGTKKNNAGITIEPIGCTKSQFGWTKKSGNANVLPTFSLMVKLPGAFFTSKDYLKYRYFDVRTFSYIQIEAQKFNLHSHCLSFFLPPETQLCCGKNCFAFVEAYGQTGNRGLQMAEGIRSASILAVGTKGIVKRKQKERSEIPGSFAFRDAIH